MKKKIIKPWNICADCRYFEADDDPSDAWEDGSCYVLPDRKERYGDNIACMYFVTRVSQ